MTLADDHAQALAGRRSRHTVMTVMSGGRVKSPAKRRDDFWPTCDGVLRSLCQEQFFCWSWPFQAARVWEPFCGDGALVRQIEREGATVVAKSDINPRGCGVAADFWDDSSVAALVPRDVNAIITNPPWKDVPKIARRCLDLLGWVAGEGWCSGDGKLVALLVQQHAMNTAGWGQMFRDGYAPDIVAPLTYRVDWTGGKRPVNSATWLVWEPVYRRSEWVGRQTIMKPLYRPVSP